MELLKIFKESHNYPRTWWKLEEQLVINKGYLDNNMKVCALALKCNISIEEVELWSKLIYNKDFKELLRELRIDELIELMYKYRGRLSVESYAVLSGYETVTEMSEEFYIETKMDYFELFQKIKNHSG